MKHISKFTANGCEVKIDYDDAPNPLTDFDIFGHFYKFTDYYRAYRTEYTNDKNGYKCLTALQEAIDDREIIPAVVIGFHLGGSQTVFNPDDYGSLKGWEGIYYCTAEELAAEGWEDPKEGAIKCMLATINEWQEWANGEVYYYTIQHDGEILDACGGFYGLEHCEEAARAAAEGLTVPPSRAELIEVAYNALCARLATTENIFLDEDEQRTYEALRAFLKN